MKLGSFLVVVGIIVFVHELGHFIAAKSVGIRVIRFSIGFPPRLFSWKSKGTDFQIGAIPFGGYVKMAGVIDESWGDKESAITGAPDEFTSKNVFQKTWVLSAGVLFNIVFAWLLAIIISFFQGKPLVAEPVVGNVVENLPAAIDLKLQENDRIIQIDTVPIHHWNDITSIIHTHPNKNLSFVWVRGNDTLTGITSPIERPINTDDGTIRKVGLIGISPKVQYADISLIEAIQIGSQMTWFIIKNTFIGFYNLFTGTSTIKELVGPIGIVKLSGESVQSGTSSFFSFILLISISVGLINILPIPMLDGGHILIAWIEAIRRKSISIEWKIRIQKIGMIFLLLLIIWVSYHDILRLWSNP
ncbi:MAG: RIP metalloprotease RseP [bacterium]|nr:RIP metalloprotease RseP [bacterium]